ncbi:MAG: hypothetical protein ACYS30_22930 [Planctomycetota bacterium]|jgi:hypothetical protein
MADATSVIDNFVREELPKVLHESLPAIAPVYNNIEQTSIEVQRDTGIGRGWKVIHLYKTGVAGLIESANPQGPGMFAFTGAQANQLQMGTAASDLAPFPVAADAPHTASLKRELPLHMVTGNFSIPVTWMQADSLTAAQIKQVTSDIKAVADLRAMVEAISFFAKTVSDGTYDFDVLGRLSAAATESSDYVTFTLDESYGRIANFRIGMALDCVADDGSDQICSGVATDATDVLNYAATGIYVHLVVTAVDYLAKTVTVAGVNDTTGALAAFDTTNGWYGSGANPPTTNDWLVLKRCSRYISGARPMLSWGLEDWIKSSGYILGGTASAQALDLGVFTQFKSQVVAVNAPLTDTVMNSYIGGFLDAYPGQTIDTIITTQGVTLKYLEQPGLYNNRMNYDRTGKALKVAGGWDSVEYSFNGRNLNWIISPLCLSNTLYALKFGGGNIKRYVPPTVGGKDSRFTGEIQFLAPVGGHTGIFKIAHDSNGACQNFVEAPFWQYKLVAPVDPRAVKLTGLTEATMT